MSLLASVAMALSIKLIFPFNRSYLSDNKTRLDYRGSPMSWHLMVCSHSPSFNGRNWEEGREKAAGKVLLQVLSVFHKSL